MNLMEKLCRYFSAREPLRFLLYAAAQAIQTALHSGIKIFYMKANRFTRFREWARRLLPSNAKNISRPRPRRIISMRALDNLIQQNLQR
jgi:hypothetical protein